MEVLVDNRKLCEMYRILVFAHDQTRQLSYRHLPKDEDDARSRDYIALKHCEEEGYIKFLSKTGPGFVGEPVQTTSRYVVTWAGEFFLDRYRKD